MTQRDTNPADLPQAIPVLSYERQTNDGEMEWVVRFIGAWVICAGATPMLQAFAEICHNGFRAAANYRDPFQWTLLGSLFCSLTLILFGIAAARRYRYGFYGSLTMAAMAPMPALAFYISMPVGPARVALFVLPSFILPAALFAVLLSVLRRADAKGVLQPVRTNQLDTLQDDNSIEFLISRVGWLYLAEGGKVLVDFAIWPLLIWVGMAKLEWSWQAGVRLAMGLAVCTCGMLLYQRKASALGLLAWILPIQMLTQFLITWDYYSTKAVPATGMLAFYLCSFPGIAANIFMLCLLARKAGRTSIPSH